MADPKSGSPQRPEEMAREELRKERDDFLKAFFRKGVELTEELVRERDAARHRLMTLEEENTRLRAQVASGDAIRELIRKIGELESEKERVLHEFREVQVASSRQSEGFAEVESELANLANLYIASFQLHSSLDPRGVLQNIKELLAQFVGAEAFALYLFLSDAGKLVPVVSEGVADSELHAVAPGEGPLGEVFSTGRALVREGDSRQGSVSSPVAIVPLKVRDRMAGVLVVFRTLEQKPSFIQVDHELLKLLSAQAMTALVAARLFTSQSQELLPFSSLSDLGI